MKTDAMKDVKVSCHMSVYSLIIVCTLIEVEGVLFWGGRAVGRRT